MTPLTAQEGSKAKTKRVTQQSAKLKMTSPASSNTSDIAAGARALMPNFDGLHNLPAGTRILSR